MSLNPLAAEEQIIVRPFASDSLTTPTAHASQREQIAAHLHKLPDDHRPYTDKYFLRTREVLAEEGFNPWVRAQIFIRQGDANVFGINEALAIALKYSNLTEHGGRIFAKREGEHFDSKEPLMFIDGPVQDIIELETMILGVLSRETTRFNDGMSAVDLNQVRDRMGAVVKAAEGRPILYAGPRHWGYEQDRAISAAAHEAGAVAVSTDIGAKAFGGKGEGTIPHALEVIFCKHYGRDEAVKQATLAFDKHMEPSVARLALVDFNNHEIDDALATAEAFRLAGKKLEAVRVDTCGENLAQGALASPDCPEAGPWHAEGIPLIPSDDPDARYWYGKGVTVTGVYSLRKALDELGFEDVKIVLSSGFGKKAKVEAFTRAEKILGVKLFDSLLAGEVWDGGRIATMDLVAVSETKEGLERPENQGFSKVGRPYRPNPTLKEVKLADLIS